MTQIPIYQVDAFTGRLFAGNPAAICPLEEWLEDEVLQAIAAENNLAETAYFIPHGDRYDLRWFTPEIEIDLCGHATLASAFVILKYLRPSADSITFDSRGGRLTVGRSGDRLAMDFPSRPPAIVTPPPDLLTALGVEPKETWAARDYMAVFESEDQVRALKPDMALLSGLDRFVIVTAPGNEVDFVSRFFAPSAGIPEDPVTGSAHCTLIPYWSERLGKKKLEARQVSKRGGELWCEDCGSRVMLSGRAVLYMEGRIFLD